jgi:hypothetical protein
VGIPSCCQYVHPAGMNPVSRSKADMTTTLCGTNIGWKYWRRVSVRQYVKMILKRPLCSGDRGTSWQSGRGWALLFWVGFCMLNLMLVQCGGLQYQLDYDSVGSVLGGS